MHIGVLTPHAAIGPEAELPEMAPGRLRVRVKRLPSEGDGGVGSDPPSTSDLRTLLASTLLDPAARSLMSDGVEAIAYASTTSAYAIGFDAEAAMVSRLSERLGIPVASTSAAAVLALRTLGTGRVALVGAPWFDPEFNRLGADYFRGQGFEVVWSRSAELATDPARIGRDDIVSWTSRRVGDDADAVFIGGNGFLAAGAIEPLESVLSRPVLSSNQVLLWKLLNDAGAPFTVSGYGRLFSKPPMSYGAPT